MRLVPGTVVALLALVTSAAVSGASGNHLDRTFADRGVARFTFVGNDQPAAVAIQRDGKIVVAGAAYTSPVAWDFAVARFLQNGRLDRSFGTGGKVLVDVAGDTPDSAEAVAIQRDGKIVVAGWSGSQGRVFESDLALVRLTADGRLDTGFGGDGKVVTDVGPAGVISALAIQGDGRLVVAGARQHGGGWNFLVARYRSDGSLDASFDQDGWQITDLRSTPVDFARAVAVRLDGAIVAAGEAGFNVEPGGFTSDFAAVRYRPDGALDQGFGGGGQVLVDIAAWDSVADIAHQPDGKLVLAGHAGHSFGNRPSRFALLRLNSNGTLDERFGRGGTALAGFSLDPRDRASALVPDPDGKLVLAGVHRRGTSSAPGNFALARYLPNGTLDRSFGNAGVLVTDLGRDEAIVDVARQRDGKLVALGSEVRGTAWRFVLARYVAQRGCRVPDVRRRPLRNAARVLAGAGCRVGRVTFRDSTLPAGTVVAQLPRPGTNLARGGRVNLVVSRNR